MSALSSIRICREEEEGWGILYGEDDEENKLKLDKTLEVTIHSL